MGNRSALVVDDSKSARFALRKYLEGHAFHVDTAESAEEAFAFLKSHRPDLIFLDHVMPGTDGFEALRHLKADPQTGSIPVVICSSNEGAEFTTEARSKGAAEVLQKPPSPEQLGRILANLQSLSAQLRPAAAPPKPAEPAAVASPPASPSKVSNIREPEVAIEQAVMKVIRSALPTPPAATPAAAFSPGATGSFLIPAATPPPAAPPPAAPGFGLGGAFPPAAPAAPATPAAPTSTFAPGSTGSFLAPAPSPGNHAASPKSDPSPVQLSQLRDQMEARMKKITHDLFVQIAELKAAIATVESERQPSGIDESQMQAMTQATLSAVDERLAAPESRIATLESRLANLEHGVEAVLGDLRSQLSDLRGQIESALHTQSARIDQVVQAARAAAHEEAHAAAERTVMSAGSRIADQLADSILKALGRR